MIKTLNKADSKAVTIIALMEQLLLEMLRINEPKTRRANLVTAMQEKLVALDNTYLGGVPEEYLKGCENFLKTVEDAVEAFIFEVKEKDLLK